MIGALRRSAAAAIRARPMVRHVSAEKKFWEKSAWDVYVSEVGRDGFSQFFAGKVVVVLMAFGIHLGITEDDRKESVYYSKLIGTYGSHH